MGRSPQAPVLLAFAVVACALGVPGCDPGEDPEPDADTAPDTEASTPSDAEAEARAEADEPFEPEREREAGELGPPHCPQDMVLVPEDPLLGVDRAFCIDRYEASRSDASATHPGSATDIARSIPGVLPWYANPMTPEAMQDFRNACAAANKRLCESHEWFDACTGPAERTYVFGDVFDVETCNCVDTFCDDHCAESGIPVEDCVTSANCGYTYSCYRLTPTGQFAGCTNEYGTYDVTGNLWEIVPSSTDARGYEVRGGAFNCAGASTRLQCSFNASWTSLYAGFRCCRDPLR